MKDKNFMDLAIEEAQKAAERGEVPVGAVIVDEKGDVIAAAGNRMLELNDPTAHAEMLVIRQACKIRSSQRLTGCDLYVSLEPCPMCAQAISAARIRRLYYGAEDPKSGGVDHGPRIFDHGSAHHKPEVYGGIGEDKAARLLTEFFAAKRA